MINDADDDIEADKIEDDADDDIDEGGYDDIDHLVAALEAGECEGGVPVGLYLGVDVGAHVEQHLYGGSRFI